MAISPVAHSLSLSLWKYVPSLAAASAFRARSSLFARQVAIAKLAPSKSCENPPFLTLIVMVFTQPSIVLPLLGD